MLVLYAARAHSNIYNNNNNNNNNNNIPPQHGRWHGVGREDRVLYGVGSGEVEDIDHFVISCEYAAEERERMKG